MELISHSTYHLFLATSKINVRILANLTAGLRMSELQPHNDTHAAVFSGKVYGCPQAALKCSQEMKRDQWTEGYVVKRI